MLEELPQLVLTDSSLCDDLLHHWSGDVASSMKWNADPFPIRTMNKHDVTSLSVDFFEAGFLQSAKEFGRLENP